jgi:signal transduction histidine kinase
MEDLERSIAPAKARVLEDIARGAPLGRILRTIVEMLEDFSPEPVYGSIMLADEDGSRLVVGAAPSLERAFSEEIDGVPIAPHAGSCGSAAYFRRPVIASDISEDPLWEEYREIALGYGLRACWSTPIIGEGQVLGTFAMYSRQVRAPTALELKLLQTASSLAAVAIEKERNAKSRLDKEDSLGPGASGGVALRALAQIPAAVAVTRGPRHLLQAASRRFLRSAGLSEAQALGRPLVEVWRCLEPGRLGPLLDRVYSSGRRYSRREMRITLARRRHAARRMVVDFLCLPLRDGNGSVTGLCLYAFDVTAAVTAREQLRALQRQKDDFLASLAHDLRNPATVIAGNAAILLRALESGNLDNLDLFRDSLEAIASTSRRLVLRFSDLLDLVRLDAGKTPPLLAEPVDLVPLARRVMQDLARTGYEHPMRLQCQTSSIIGEWDPTRIESVLINLIDNALKYSPSDREVEVRLSVEGTRARIDVLDRGPGMDSADLSRLFVPYWRGRAAAGVAGAGVGLMSVKRTVELHGGEISVSSNIGQGSTFTVHLPLGQPAEPSKVAGG